MTDSRYRPVAPRGGAPSHQALTTIVGAESDPKHVTERLARASEEFHLVAPQTSAGTIPEGCSVALSAVVLNVDAETYPIPGSSGRGLSKVALDKIAAAAGISWDPNLSRRLDDGRDPRYCHYRVVGHVRDFDGTTRTLTAEKEMDVREGSPQVEAIVERCVRKVQKDNPQLSAHEATRLGRQAAENQIRELRLHLLSHAETKARLRAIRTLGVRTSYSTAELGKAFVVAKLAWTGRTSDPELRREFALAQQRAMFGANAALYGVQAAPTSTLHVSGPRPTPAPPIGMSNEPLFEEELIDVEAEESYREAPVKAVGREMPRSAPPASTVTYSGVVIPGGQAKGTPIEEASDKDLDYWRNRIAESLDSGASKFPDKDERWLNAAFREIARRMGGTTSDEEIAESDTEVML